MSIQEKAKLLLFAHTDQPSINPHAWTPHTWAWHIQIMTLPISQAPVGLGVLSRAMSGLPLLLTLQGTVNSMPTVGFAVRTSEDTMGSSHLGDNLSPACKTESNHDHTPALSQFSSFISRDS